ncbi:hypothetical protein [Sorangium sp. So ce513]|uniref:hypothetical protein n=1 Tax=Sorangium sp. So ce513 TaxID=3133315 RepID=UPI003F5E6D30
MPCPWCCTCSSPRGQTFLALDRYRASFPAEGPFEVQLEGGEPTIHPRGIAIVLESAIRRSDQGGYGSFAPARMARPADGD